MPPFYESCMRVQAVTHRKLRIQDLGYAYQQWLMASTEAAFSGPVFP